MCRKPFELNRRDKTSLSECGLLRGFRTLGYMPEFLSHLAQEEGVDLLFPVAVHDCSVGEQYTKRRGLSRDEYLRTELC